MLGVLRVAMVPDGYVFGDPIHAGEGMWARSLPEKREQLFQLILVRLAAIFADLEGLRELHLPGPLRAVELPESAAKAVGGAGENT